jgi:putative nucleotidyltransferase with HDIG domain
MLKQKNRTRSSELIESELNKAWAIQPFPRVVSQLLSATNDSNANSKSLANIIESDAALSTRLLRMANGPLYGYSNVIRSIDHATTILGIRPLRNLALTYAGSTVFAIGSVAEQRDALWDHSLGCATIARLLAKFVSTVEPDEAFLAGIFHDVGKLFFHDVVPREYARLAGVSSGTRLMEQEQEEFGFTHEEVGSKLATAWQLPEQLVVVVGHHHRPEQAIAHNELTAVVHVADGLARAGGVGSPIETGDNVLDIAREYLCLDKDTTESIQEQAFEMFEETKQAFSD